MLFQAKAYKKRLYGKNRKALTIPYGDPGRSRTCDLLIRSQTLYPAELQSHILKWWAHLGSNQGPTGYEPVALPLSYRPEIYLATFIYFI